MKFSEQWLRQWVDPNVETDALAYQMTMAGIEVDSIERAAPALANVVIARVEHVEPHPDADKLQVCQVTDGTQTVSVVCGAPNARAGITVALAKVGSVLPGDFAIKSAKVRGVDSQGMLCSAKELGLSDDHAGIIELPSELPLGQSLDEALALNDQVFEVELTPNRADCLSVLGIAREVSVLNQMPLQWPEIAAVAVTSSAQRPVTVLAPEACPRYLGRVIENINPLAQTPHWMAERLRRSGIRCIDPVVDVTNYVMLELGQPMHGFDLEQIHQGIVVRFAKSGEALTLLDESVIELNSDTLIIADHERPLAMAGVMGGQDSGIQDTTHNIFLECAFFAPLALAGQARRHGLHTDASHRFERGVDPNLQHQALNRATQLLLDIVGGEPGPVVEAADESYLPQGATIALPFAQIQQVLGLELPTDWVTQTLEGLAFAVTKTDDGWLCTAPSHRFDMAIAEDLIEELARIYGYEHLPVSQPKMALALPASPESVAEETQIKQRLLSYGYHEIVSYSFISADMQSMVDAEQPPLALANPISEELAVMRTTLSGGLLRALKHNLNRQQQRVRLFETGLVFQGSLDDLRQEKRLGGLIYGPRYDAPWLDRERLDFFDLKAHVEGLCQVAAGRRAQFTPLTDVPLLHPGQAAQVWLGDQPLGWLGQLHPALQAKLDIKQPVFLFELDLVQLLTRAVPKAQAISKFPSSQRDIAVIVPHDVSSGAVMAVVRESAGEWLLSSEVFDVYTGAPLQADEKSLAIAMNWQHPERTLQDEEVAQWMSAVIEQLNTQFGATLRS
jgi:phenylalanyl-tRNA synthetase beta chain